MYDRITRRTLQLLRLISGSTCPDWRRSTFDMKSRRGTLHTRRYNRDVVLGAISNSSSSSSSSRGSSSGVVVVVLVLVLVVVEVVFANSELVIS